MTLLARYPSRQICCAMRSASNDKVLAEKCRPLRNQLVGPNTLPGLLILSSRFSNGCAPSASTINSQRTPSIKW